MKRWQKHVEWLWGNRGGERARGLGKVCDALPDDDARQSVAQLRTLSAHHGPSKKCVSTIVNINDQEASFAFFF
jgi:hypothetical protein